MINIHRLAIPTVIVGILLIGLPTFAQAEPNQRMQRGYDSDHRRGDSNRSHMVDHTLLSLLRQAKDLGLTDEQIAKLKSLMTDYRKTRILDKADVKLARVDVRALAHDEKADIAAIEGAVRKLEGAQAKLLLDGIKAARAASATLTPEQREKWRSGRSRMHAEGEGVSINGGISERS
jgi:Spy/CpxP family protein refolding chaperone